MPRIGIFLLAVLVAALGGGQVSVHQADASFPGANGKIVFSRALHGFVRVSANCDGTTDAIDAVLVLQFDAGLLTEEAFKCWGPMGDFEGVAWPDANEDGQFDSVDAALILQFTAGLLKFDQDIYTVNPDGTGQTRLTDHLSDDIDPAWSPDGTKIAFSSCEGGCGTHVMNADGSGEMSVTNVPAAPGAGGYHWSPDGTKIAFSDSRDIFAMNADGSGQTNVTNSSGFWNDGPSWSPDGTKIAFTSYRDGNQDIYVMNADGSGQTNLTNSSNFYDGSPNWSPDGTKIAFGSRLSGENDSEIYVMNADGSGETNLSDDPGSHNPAWSPDGTKIAFVNNVGIYVMNPDGSGQRWLTQGHRFDGVFVWSPDSTKIAFTSGTMLEGERIYVMNADGTSLAAVVSLPRLTSPSSPWQLDWQALPDGR